MLCLYQCIITALEVVIVGLAIVEIVVEPPNATLEPLIVILEFANLHLQLNHNWSFVIPVPKHLHFGNVTVLEDKSSVVCNCCVCYRTITWCSDIYSLS